MTKNKDVYNVTHTKFNTFKSLSSTKNNIRDDAFYTALKKSKDQYEKSIKFVPDSIVQKVQNEMNERAEKGFTKYNNTLDRTDLSVIDYLQHAKEEAMDLALYLEKTIQMLKGNG